MSEQLAAVGFCGQCHGRGQLTGMSRVKVKVVYDCTTCKGTGLGLVKPWDLLAALVDERVIQAIRDEMWEAWARGYDEGVSDAMNK